jgi:hypothetical protein
MLRWGRHSCLPAAWQTGIPAPPSQAAKQLIGEVCPPPLCRPGQPYRYESHYLRAGVGPLFLWYEPLAGRRGVRVRGHKGAVDWAEVIAELLEVHYPQAKKVRLVMDQHNTHAGGSLYQAFAPERARRPGWRTRFSGRRRPPPVRRRTCGTRGRPPVV